MKVTQIKLTKRLTTGVDYEFNEIEVIAAVEGKESLEEALTKLNDQLESACEAETKETKPKKEKKNAKSKTNASDDEDEDQSDSEEETSGDDDEGNSDEEASDSEDGDDSDSDGDDSESDEEESSSKKGGKKASAKSDTKKGGSKKRGQAQTYSREIEQHKEIFGRVLASANPDWKKSQKTKDLARKASEEMDGENFLDDKGEVIPQFKVLVARLMRGKGK